MKEQTNKLEVDTVIDQNYPDTRIQLYMCWKKHAGYLVEIKRAHALNLHIGSYMRFVRQNEDLLVGQNDLLVEQNKSQIVGQFETYKLTNLHLDL